MAARDWIVGGSAAVLGGLFGLGAGRAMSSPPAEPSAAPPAPVAAAAPSSEAWKARETELLRREAALAERERAFEARPAAAVQAALPASAPAEIAPVAAAALSEEEKIRKEILESAGALGALLARLKEGDVTGGEEQDQMQAVSDLMAAMARFKKHEKLLVGDFGADATMAVFDGMMPEELKTTEEQRLRFRELHRDMESRLRLAGIPLEKGGIMGMSGPGGLSTEQQSELRAAQGEMLERGMALLSPPQSERFLRIEGGGEGAGGGQVRIQVGGPSQGMGD